ncbi:arginyltransferase [uncultured Maritalea sp.]|jgi:arginyl-tRNA--protein-N-Asp/Glu arginylyltransferase|uniref:arginyltransferase n=1 Tax=uncultured Maritalea sp. TaxID=757249 RepID=UPI00260F94AB|nr:arginyltransferase [uncultured Maritalea sp.]
MTEHSPSDLQFYLTAETACPYLPEKYERKLFTHLAGRRAADLHNMLSVHGFRRSQNIAYRPACDGCQACQSARVLVAQFKRNANQRRIWRKNQDIVSTDVFPHATQEQYLLFKRYLKDRHKNGGMSEMSHLDYEFMVEDTPVQSVVVEYRERTPIGEKPGPLLAVALTDILPDGISMVYSFFDSDLSNRSLGKFMVLDQIERARAAGLPHLYLGYWVKNSPKMAYKSSFKPLEVLGNGDHWQLLDEDQTGSRQVR